MSSKEVRQRTEAALASKWSSHEKIVYIWLLVPRPSGVSAKKIATSVHLTEPQVQAALDNLEGRGMVAEVSTRMGGKVWKVAGYPTLPRVEKKSKTLEVVPPEQHDRTRKGRALLNEYKRARQLAGHRGMLGASEDKLIEYFAKVQDFLDEAGTDFQKYLSFAKKQCAWMDHVSYPTPAILAGKWLQTEWATATPEAPRASRETTAHAGFDYGNNEDVRAALLEADFDVARWSKQQLWYCATAAQDILRGKGAKVTEKYKPMVEHLVAIGRKDGGE
jgi:hypothetical protein